MKKIISLFIVMSLLCFGNLFAATTASDSVTPTYRNTTTYSAMSCTATNPTTIINGSTFTVACDWRSNDNDNIIQIKTNNAGELLNNINSNLTPRPYTGSYVITDSLDTMANTASDATTSALTTEYATIFNVDTDVSVVADETLGGTVTGTFTISDGLGTGQTLNDLYLGTYTDTIHVKITQQ